MNKKEFMQNLKNTLLFKYDYNEVKDILYDYEEFFTIGLSEGKSEDELCEQFGNIKKIAADLSLELKQKTTLNRSLPAKLLARLFIATAFLIFTITYVIGLAPNTDMIRNSVIGVLFFITGAWFILGGGLASIPSTSYQSSLNYHKLFIAMHIALSVLIFVFYLILRDLETGWMTFVRPPFNIPIDKLGSFTLNTIYCLIVLVAILFIYSLFCFYHSSVFSFTVTCHCIGCLVFLLCSRNILLGLADISAYKTTLTLCLLPYVASIILALLFSAFISFLHKRRS